MRWRWSLKSKVPRGITDLCCCLLELLTRTGKKEALLNKKRMIGYALGCLSLVAGTAVGQVVGADVTHQDIQGTSNFGMIGGIRAYAIGSYTCNLGDTTLIWQSSGSPGLAMNAYRLKNGRLEMVGMSWVKHACCAASGSGCGTCNTSAPGSGLKPGCRDIYSASYNGGQGRLGPRTGINPYAGTFTALGSSTGLDAIARRLQIADVDLQAAQNPGSLYFLEGVYVGIDDAANRNFYNNATYKRCTVDAASNLVVTGTATSGTPAIQAWRDHGLGVNTPDTNVNIGMVDVVDEGRFYVANKVVAEGNLWRYEYAVFNLNSHRAGGGFEIPVPAGVTVSQIGFKDVNYHSGEQHDNTDWIGTHAANKVRWASARLTDPNKNTNSNAMLWGTMYNFWFLADRPPVAANGTVVLYRDGASVNPTISLRGPSAPPCPADLDGDSDVDSDDITIFFAAWDAGESGGDFDGDGDTDSDDISAFFARWDSGC